jgi:PsbN protein
MEPAIVLMISVCAVVLAVTAYAIYLSFGPPANELADPFDDHDD